MAPAWTAAANLGNSGGTGGPVNDRRGRIRRMAAAVAKQDVYQWLDRELRTLRV